MDPPAALDELLGGCPDDLLALPADDRWTEIRARYRLPRDWHAATDDGRLGGGALHDADGEVVFGIGITTDPRERQRGIAQALLDGALAIARRQGARSNTARRFSIRSTWKPAASNRTSPSTSASAPSCGALPGAG